MSASAASPGSTIRPEAGAAGEPLLLDYNVQDYFNACGPHNPDCVDGEFLLSDKRGIW